MVLQFQSDLFSNRNLRANIRIGKDTKKAQSILNRERQRERERETETERELHCGLQIEERRQKVQVEFEVKKEGKKYIKQKKKKKTLSPFFVVIKGSLYINYLFLFSIALQLVFAHLNIYFIH